MARRDDVLVRFGKRLRDLRQAQGLSQEEFAYQCGLDRTYISGIERGRRNVSLRNIEKLAANLGLSLAQLMKANLDRLIDGDRPPYCAQDFVHETLVGASFEDVLGCVGNDLYVPKTRGGRFVFYNVGPLARSGKLDVIALGENALASDLARRLTRL